jgi:2-oxoglutarate dehydrogenase E1 component
VFIDLVSYRKYGHNEGDEPSFTQPLLYKKIKAHPSPREAYAAQLEGKGVMPAGTGQKIVDEITTRYIVAQELAKKNAPYDKGSMLDGPWKGLTQPHSHEEMLARVATEVEEKTLKAVAAKINRVPDGFHMHPKLARFFEARQKAIEEGKGIDWGSGEALAYATLISEGYRVRITGQDAERGTFTHRHSVLNDSETGEKYAPFNQVAANGGRYEVHNSFLSETAVMGFEYGYSLAEPKALVIWEAQFGDFANGAQVIIDQFIATSESKWGRMSGLVLLLPHGYEGQGPEHSSARLERFLQLSGRDNWTVANLTTPAQIFHAMRRQVKRSFRRPLVIMSPKSLLRHPMAVSTLDEFTKQSFQEVIGDPTVEASQVKRVVLSSGKVYYDLLAERAARKRTDVALVRVEQLYPWPGPMLAKILSQYPKAEIVWAQEEPRNMGSWGYVFNLWMGGTGDFSREAGGRAIRYAGRAIAASPAVGYPKVHEHEQKTLIAEALG